MEPQYHIAIDGNEANVINRVGSNVYAFELITALSELLRNDSRFQVTVLLSNKPVKDLPRTRKWWRYQVIGPRQFWTQWALPIHLFLESSKYQVLFTPGHYAPRISSVPYVSSVMDLAFLEFTEQFNKNDLLQLTNWTAYSVKHARKVIAISEYTKQDVIKKYGRKPDDVVVAPPAVNPPQLVPSAKDGAKVAKKFGITDPYIIHIGTFQPRKNVLRLIDAFEQVSRKMASTSLKHQPKKYQLVLVGKIGWLAEPIVKRIKQSPFANQIITTGYVSEEEKLTLLKFAQCSVHVGLYEGFGIPALESLHLGTIPIVSNQTSLPEVVGKAGILVDPYSANDIAKGIEHTLSLKARDRAKLRKVGRAQIQYFNWQKSAQIVLNTLTAIIESQLTKQS